jgi:GT2 family glycosyltransferase
MHDDVHFYSQNWGVSCVNKFDNENIGAIGLAGSAYAPLFPGPWWKTGFICQHLYNKRDISYGNSSAVQLPILVLDGFWMCIRKQLFEQIKFDVNLFNGFHFYDLDICMQIHQLGHSIISVYDIDIAHHSNGKLNLEWQKSALKFNSKWRKILPASVAKISFFNIIKSEFTTLFDYLRIVVKNVNS